MRIIFIKILFLCVHSLNSHSLSKFPAPNSAEGWLSDCGGLDVDASSCPHGAWLSTPRVASCLCLHGLWAIGKSWCDEDYQIFLGRGHCFKIDQEVQRIAFLGHSEDAFSPVNFLTKKGQVFKPFSSSVAAPYDYENEMEEEKTILRLSPGDEGKYLFVQLTQRATLLTPEMEEENSRVCIPVKRTEKKTEEASLEIIKIKESIKQLQIIVQCPSDVRIMSNQELALKVSTIRIKFGQGLHVKSGRIEDSVSSCGATCHRRPQRKRRAIKEKSSPLDPLSTSSTYVNKTMEQRKQLLVNEETLRVIKAEVSFLLMREKPPQLTSANWELLRRAKEAFIKVCPKVQVPEFLVNSLFRLFRYLYINSKDSNPFGHFFEEGPQNTRIAQALDMCIKDAEPLEFEYGLKKVNGTCALKNSTEFDLGEGEEGGGNQTASGNGTKPSGNGTAGSEGSPKLVMYCQCRNEIEMVNLNYTKNASNPNERFNLTKDQFTLPQNLSYPLLPRNDTFNGSYHDFPVETAWKVVEFAHYYCAKYFKDRPADHSAMLIKFEKFFNDDITYRWGHPGRRTNETWQNLYAAFNLEQFAESVDACVASAKHVSDYPEWLSRPTLDFVTRRRRSLEKLSDAGNDAAYCLQDAWEPVHKLGHVSENCQEWNSL